MFERFSDPVRHAIVVGTDEAARRGDARVGSQHLLLGLLDEGPAGTAAVALGADLETVRAALDRLDRTALAGVGVLLDELPTFELEPRARRRPFNSAAKRVLERSLREAVAQNSRELRAEHVLLALLACEPPDPTAAVLAELAIDPEVVRARLRPAA